MKRRLLFLAVIFSLTSFFLRWPINQEVKPSGLPKQELTQTTDNLLVLVNQERKKKRLLPLKSSVKLTNSAQYRACEINETKKWSHEGFEEAITQYGNYQGNGQNTFLIGENLARNVWSDERVVFLWMASLNHSKLILGPDYLYAGVGRCNNIVVLHFGGI